MGRHSFFEQFFGALFLLKIAMFGENGSPNRPKMKTLGSYLSEKVQNWKSVFGLRRRGRIAYEPIPWSAQGDPKLEEKKGHISEPLFLGRKCKKCEKWYPKCLQKGATEKVVAPLGAVLGHVWCPKPFFDYKNEPIALPKCLQEPKITQKMTPEVEK